MAPLTISINKYRHRSKVAAFDYDWTLVKPKEGRQFPKDVDDWTWLAPSVPETLQAWYKKGYGIVVFTNQTKVWKVDQIKTVMSSIGIPILAMVAMDKADHKPNKIMWETAFHEKKLKLETSFFVGDALGRKNDWSDSDKVFAETNHIKVMSPEKAFNLVAIAKEIVQDHVQVKPNEDENQELIIMVGYPASGKSTIAANIAGYVHVESDVLKTHAKIVKELKKNLEMGNSVVLDATNPTKAGRAEYIEIAKSKGIQVRCIWMKTPIEEAIMRNSLRPENKQVPKITFYVYRKKFEEPTEAEGFTLEGL